MSAIRKRLYYLWKKSSEKQRRKKYTNIYFKEEIERFNASEDRKPQSLIRQEMKALQNYWDCFPYQYYRFDMYRNDCTLSIEEMKKYVPYYFSYNLFFPISAKEYEVLCDDKLLTYAMLKTYNTLQPKMLFGFDNNSFYDDTNTPVSNVQVDAIIKASTAAKLFIKPRFGLGGKGIAVFTRKDNQFINAEGKVLDHSFFLNELTGGVYIVQEGLVQHQSISAIYPHSINTFRVITECVNGEPRVLYALLRMGRGGKQVDNASSGGVYTKLDPLTGTLGDYAIANNRVVFKAHPDTNFVFKDSKMESWTEVKRFALVVAKKFREIKYIGWDIGLSPEGPTIIEINKRPDMEMIQDFYGGIRDDLKIKPKDWWYRSDFTLKNIKP
jgi:hypothetical protein